MRVIAAGDLFGGSVYGPIATAPFLDRFQTLVPGSVVDRAGIRAGDAIDLRRMTPAERYWERNELLAGKPMRLPIVRSGALRWVTVTPETYTNITFFNTYQWMFNWAFWLGSALSLVIAAILIWRRPDNAEVRLLSARSRFSTSSALRVAVSAAIALGLGLSLHQIHKRVDQFVDNVFFRKRHEDERALEKYAREVAFITDPTVVIERAARGHLTGA